MLTTLSEGLGTSKKATALIMAILLIIIGAVGFRVAFVNFVDNYELGYKYDLLEGGKITHLFTIDTDGDTTNFAYDGLRPQTGYFVTPPFFVKIHTIDLRPMQVCINANSRVLNCKLVRFNPAGLDLFLSWHGRGDYTAVTLNPILMSYAYDGSGKVYPFLDILRELKPEEVAP